MGLYPQVGSKVIDLKVFYHNLPKMIVVLDLSAMENKLGLVISLRACLKEVTRSYKSLDLLYNVDSTDT